MIFTTLQDPSIDRIQTAGIPILKKFLAGDNDVVLTICKRGAAPLGGGEIHFKCPISRNLKTIQVFYCFYALYCFYNIVLHFGLHVHRWKTVEW